MVCLGMELCTDLLSLWTILGHTSLGLCIHARIYFDELARRISHLQYPLTLSIGGQMSQGSLQ